MYLQVNWLPLNKACSLSLSSCQCGRSTTAAPLCHCSHCLFPLLCKIATPCEARTHDLQIMRLTRCLLRQRGHTCHMYASKHCPLLRHYTTCLVIAPVMTSGQMPWEDGLQASSDLNLPAAQGELAQMVERSLSMREVAGSMPAFSKEPTIFTLLIGRA